MDLYTEMVNKMKTILISVQTGLKKIKGIIMSLVSYLPSGKSLYP